MGQVLRFPGPPERLHPVMGELVRSLELGTDAPPPAPEPIVERMIGTLPVIVGAFRETPPAVLRLANALWAADGARIHDGFRKTVADHYPGAFHSLDFQDDPIGARQTINASVEELTRGRIKGLVGDIPPETQLIITNAVYLKANWGSDFKEEDTEPADFLAEGGRKISLPFMKKRQFLAYADDDSFQAVAIPYIGYELSMLLLLPRDVDGLMQLEADLTPAGLADVAERLRAPNYREVDLALPKFKLEDRIHLVQALRSLGLTLAFTDHADFSGLSPDRLAISGVFHKAYFGVDEHGVEAAAATTMWVRATCATAGPPPPPPIPFRADHPFLFAIRDNRTGLIVFLGRLSEPSP